MREHGRGGLRKYLYELGVLEKGSQEEIKAAKKAYWKGYFFAYKQWQRKKKPEYNVYYSKENGEHDRIIQAAKKHIGKDIFLRTSSGREKRNQNTTFTIPKKTVSM